MIIKFNDSHNLSAQTNRTEADYFAILNAQLPDLNRVFRVDTVVDHSTVLVDYVGGVATIPVLGDNSTADSYGNLYYFTSVRGNSMDNVNDQIHYDTFLDRDDFNEFPGDKFFADADSSNLWRVYEKQDPYTSNRQLSPDTTTADQDFGWRVVCLLYTSDAADE